MISDATFRSLLARGDVFVRDGDTYRPLAAGDAERRMHIRTGDSYTLLGFTAEGVEPEPPPQRVVIDINGTLSNTVGEIDQATRPYSGSVQGCCLAYVLVVGALMLLGGLVEAFPTQTLILVVVLACLLIARKVRRGAARFSGE